MSLFDFFGGASSSEDVGNELLEAYFSEASKFSDFAYPTYDAWRTALEAKVPDIVTLVGELVTNNYASTSIGEAQDRLVSLANQSSGLATIPNIVSTAGGRGDTVNWLAGVPEIALETTADVAKLATEVAQNIGEGVTSTAKLIKYLPWILGGAAVLYIGVMAKSSGGSFGSLLGRRK